MRLLLPIPDGWPVEARGPDLVRVALPGGVRLEAALSFGAPVDETAWSEGAMLSAVPAGLVAEFVSPAPLPTEAETREGFALRLLLTEHCPEGESPATRRPLHLGAFYRFLDYAAEVAVHFPSRAAYLAVAEPLRRLLLGATVEWPDPAGATLAGLCG